MATLLNAVTTASTGSATHSGPCTVFVTGSLGGGEVVLEVSTDGTNYVKVENQGSKNNLRFRGPAAANCEAYGTYHLKATLADCTGTPSCSVITTQ